MNIYAEIRQLAKTVRAQNLFAAAKDIATIQLFRNCFDFSKLQEIYISYLYIYENLNRDIVVDKISKHVLDNDIYEDAYLMWKRRNKKDKISEKTESEKSAHKDVHLVCGSKITFPTEVK